MKYLIHFTKHFTDFKNIIQTGSLHLHYCKEDFYLGEKIISSAVHPMVSFSEYDIKTINNQVITYGKLGIAFSKEWTIKYRVHQVLYLDKTSSIAESLACLLRARRNKEKGNNKTLYPQLRLAVITIKCFTKNAIGYNSHYKMNNYNFRNENEWRYVPTKKQIDGNLISQDKSKLKTKKIRQKYNNKLLPYSMKFNIDDIEYIFVENFLQKKEILKSISIDKKRIKISNWSTELKK